MAKLIISACIYLIVSYALIITCTFLLEDWTSQTKSSLTSNTQLMNQVADDWQKSAYTRIWTTNSSTCGPNASEVYSRLYAGTSFGCDCLEAGAYTPKKKYQNITFWGKECEIDWLRQGCQNAHSMWPIWQSTFNGTRVCGEQNGPKFLEVSRFLSNMTCPWGTQRCSNLTSTQNTICMADLDNCPITQIEFVSQNKLETYRKANQQYAEENNSSDKEPLYDIQTFNSYSALVSSKIVDALPVTTIKIDHQPCMDPLIQTTQNLYFLELQNKTECPKEPNTGLVFDPRYNVSSGFQISLSDLYEQNQVTEKLEDLPGYYIENESQTQQNYNLFAWQRNTIPWNLECEWNGTMSRQQAFLAYDTTFKDPQVDSQLLIQIAFYETIGFVGILILITLIKLLCSLKQQKKKDKKVDPNRWFKKFITTLWIVSRMALITTFVLLFLRINQSYIISSQNQSSLQNLIQPSVAQKCADPLTIIDNDKFASQFKQIDTHIKISWWFVLAIFVWLSVEFFVMACCYSILSCFKTCSGDKFQSARGMYASDSVGPILLSRDSMVALKQSESKDSTDDHFIKAHIGQKNPYFQVEDQILLTPPIYPKDYAPRQTTTDSRLPSYLQQQQ